MPVVAKVRDAVSIASKFGLGHTFRRFVDLGMIKLEERRRTRLYTRTKPDKRRIIKEILGHKMRLDMEDSGIHRDLFLDGVREPVATWYLERILAKGDTILDIGANIGYYVLLEAKICAKVYAVEPSPTNVEFLVENLELNGIKNVEVFELALGDQDGIVPMYVSSKANLHSFYATPGSSEQLDVEMRRGDHFLEGKKPPTLIRMDVEGYELAILKGLGDSLRRVDRIFLEIHAQIMEQKEVRELIELLRRAEFTAELIIKYDRPGFSRILPNDHIDKIYEGDRGVYEVFFRRCAPEGHKAIS